MLPDKLRDCTWNHLHGNFHAPLAEKPITSCQAMNLSPNTRPGWLLNECGGSGDSTSTSVPGSGLCTMAGLQGCMTARIVVLGRAAVPALQEAPVWRQGSCCCWTAHKFSPIRDGEGVLVIWSPSLFQRDHPLWQRGSEMLWSPVLGCCSSSLVASSL